MCKTERGGKKLVSMGHTYNVQYPSKSVYEQKDFNSRVTWRCEKYPKCSAKGYSNGFNAPFTLSEPHELEKYLCIPNFVRKEVLQAREKIRERADIGSEKPRRIILGFCN